MVRPPSVVVPGRVRPAACLQVFSLVCLGPPVESTAPGPPRKPFDSCGWARMIGVSIMEIRRGRPGIRSRLVWRVLVLVSLAVPLAVVLGKRPPGENVHRPDAVCLTCHTTNRDTLEGDRDAARGLLVSDLETRCNRCHSDEGPSHRTGIRPRKPVPDPLRLSADGLITCATCHFVHGEQSPFVYFLRIDNSRGWLCLTCHERSELE